MIRSHMIWLLAVIGLCPLMAQYGTGAEDSTAERFSAKVKLVTSAGTKIGTTTSL